ncbi:MAG TPA: ABC transporter permease, partial [Candidatus Dormibacteraeota bacterium]|nr:ABC transporter permease [Candidatus Dormibacteraeota bacterium]
MLRDLALAFRTLRKSPVFAITAILTIALGVGASTAIFGVANAVLLRPLPYKNPERLVNVMSDMRARNVRDFPVSIENFTDLRDRTKTEFEDLTGVFTTRLIRTRDDGNSEQIHVGVALTNFFRLVGAKIVMGRDFVDSDGTPEPPPAPRANSGDPPENRLPIVAILSYEYFQRRYGGDRNIIGKLNTTGGEFPVQVVGVVEPNFRLYLPPAADTEAAPEMWIANRFSYDNANRNGV